MRSEEHDIQCRCVSFCRRYFPHLLIFAVPNGGRRDMITAARLKAEGVTAGVADLIVLDTRGGCHFIEMKTKTGRLQQSQKDFQREVESRGFSYDICRSLEEFKETITNF